MADEVGSESKSPADRGGVMDDTLTPDARKTLGDLAVFSEEGIELGDSLGEASRTMGVLVERHPEFSGASKELQVKVTQLRELENELAKEVMRFSHVYEDAQAEVAPVTGDD